MCRTLWFQDGTSEPGQPKIDETVQLKGEATSQSVLLFSRQYCGKAKQIPEFVLDHRFYGVTPTESLLVCLRRGHSRPQKDRASFCKLLDLDTANEPPYFLHNFRPRCRLNAGLCLLQLI